MNPLLDEPVIAWGYSGLLLVEYSTLHIGRGDSYASSMGGRGDGRIWNWTLDLFRNSAGDGLVFGSIGSGTGKSQCHS